MKRVAPALLLAAAAALLVFGLWHLFRLRFESGDVYPPYSSLRTDPLGTMAFYESLEALPGISTERDFQNVNRLPAGKGAAYLHLAARSQDWRWLPEELFAEIERFVRGGGRLAITFHPEATRPAAFTGAVGPLAPSPKKGTQAGPPQRPDEPPEGQISLRRRWGVALTHVPLKPGETDVYQPVDVEKVADLPLPETLAWHSAIVLTNVDPAWQTIYARGSNAVVVERTLGAGSIAIATDSYFLSNEALRKEPQAELLAWLVSPATRIVFDEAHFGIVESTGMAGLVRKYRLHWFALSLLALAALFVWKNSTGLLPPLPPETPPGFVPGREAAAGFINLLRRNVAPRDLIRMCFAEWTSSLMQGHPHLIARVDRAQTLVEAEAARPVRQQNPVRAYREIAEALNQPAPSLAAAESASPQP